MRPTVCKPCKPACRGASARGKVRPAPRGRPHSSGVEHSLGKGEVESSNLSEGTTHRRPPSAHLSYCEGCGSDVLDEGEWSGVRRLTVGCLGSDTCETQPVGIRPCHGRKQASGHGRLQSRWKRVGHPKGRSAAKGPRSGLTRRSQRPARCLICPERGHGFDCRDVTRHNEKRCLYINTSMSNGQTAPTTTRTRATPAIGTRQKNYQGDAGTECGRTPAGYSSSATGCPGSATRR